MRYKALFIDFYGTLVYEDDNVIAKIVTQISHISPENPDPKDIAVFWWNTFRSLFENSFLDTFQLQRQLESLSIKTVLEHYNCTTKTEGIDSELFTFWGKPDIFPETKDFLTKISLPVCIVSNIDRKDILAAMNYHELSCDMVITSEDAKSYKPREEIFLMALDKMNLSPSEVLHVGDSLSSDIVGANSCGIDSFWLNRKGRSIPSDISPTYSGNSLFDILSIL